MTAQLPEDLQALGISADAPFTPEQRIWLSGYLAGARTAVTRAEPAGATAHPPVHVLYGTETGNAELVAGTVASRLSAAGAPAEPVELDQVDAAALAAMDRVVIVCSTYGEGEMPDDADLFRQLIESADAPRLESTTYAVCALGDTAYDDFCAAGKLIDARLAELGATRALDRVDCDVMWEDQAEQWYGRVLATFAAGGTAPPAPAPVAAGPRWDRRNPFPAVLAHSVRLSGPGSDKDIRHHEFALADSGIGYAAGDALGVLPCNDPALVDALLEQGGAHQDGFLVRTDHAQGGDPPVHGDEVQAEVGRPARAVLAPGDAEHGDRGVRGEPVGAAVEELVEHEVADDQGAEGLPVGEGCEQWVHGVSSEVQGYASAGGIPRPGRSRAWPIAGRSGRTRCCWGRPCCGGPGSSPRRRRWTTWARSCSTLCAT